MKKIAAALLLVFPLSIGAAFAADKPAEKGEKAPTAQQAKMKECSAKNKGLKGDEYKKAQKACLSGEEAPAKTDAKPKTQQEKMKECSAKNKGMKGEEYKKAQSECLKG